MCDKPITEHPDVQRLISQVVQLQAENKRLTEREWNMTIELCFDDGNDPFAREELKIVDVGVADKIYVVESQMTNNLLTENKRLRGLLQVAKCPNCDDSGGIPRPDGGVPFKEVELEQCQWCDEKSQALEEKK